MPNPIYLRSNGAIDSAINDLLQAFSPITISGGVISFNALGGGAQIDTQGAAATDDLTTITVDANVQTGVIYWLRSTSTSRRITIKHNVGNIWIPSESDVVMRHPNSMYFLMYNGSGFSLIACCGGGADAPEVVPDSDQEIKCVIAARITELLELIFVDVAAALPSVPAVAAALNSYFVLVGAAPLASTVLALANQIVAEYPDAEALEADFNEWLFGSAHCYMYCAKGADDAAWTSSDVSTLQDFVGGESGAAWDILAEIFGILGATGMTNAVATGVLAVSEIDCGGGCSCNWVFEWESAGSPTLEGCTAKPRVVLRIGGGGMLPNDVDVDITVTGGTATGSDYTLTTATVTFPAGSSDGDMQTVEIDITSGDGADDGETIILSIDPDEGEIGANETHTLTILAGGCSKTWSHTFMFTVANGLQGWTLNIGNLTNSGIQTDNTFLFEAQITLPGFTVPHSSVLTRVTYVPCYTIAANRTATVNVFGNIRTHSNAIGHPNPFGPNCIATVGFASGLTETNVTGDIILSMTDNQAPNNGYISTVVFAGTGINPFTGT